MIRHQMAKTASEWDYGPITPSRDAGTRWEGVISLPNPEAIEVVADWPGDEAGMLSLVTKDEQRADEWAEQCFEAGARKVTLTYGWGGVSIRHSPSRRASRQKASVDDEEVDYAECPACSGPGAFLGTLGRMDSFRCISCGWTWQENSGVATAGRDQERDDDDLSDDWFNDDPDDLSVAGAKDDGAPMLRAPDSWPKYEETEDERKRRLERNERDKKVRDDRERLIRGEGRKTASGAFPGPHSTVYYNDAGEPLGWDDDGGYEPDEADAYDQQDAYSEEQGEVFDDGYETGSEAFEIHDDPIEWDRIEGWTYQGEAVPTEKWAEGFIAGWEDAGGPAIAKGASVTGSVDLRSLHTRRAQQFIQDYEREVKIHG